MRSLIKKAIVQQATQSSKACTTITEIRRYKKKTRGRHQRPMTIVLLRDHATNEEPRIAQYSGPCVSTVKE